MGRCWGDAGRAVPVPGHTGPHTQGSLAEKGVLVPSLEFPSFGVRALSREEICTEHLLFIHSWASRIRE